VTNVWTRPLGRPKRPVPDDRRRGAFRLLPLFAATAVSVGLAAETVPTRQDAGVPGLAIGALVAAMAIFLLGSIPARWASRGVVLMGAVLMVRYGALENGSSTRVLLWGVATAASFVLGARLEATVVDAARPPGRAGGRRSRRTGSTRAAARTVQLAVIVGALAGAGALAFGPAVARSFGAASSVGAPPNVTDASGSPLQATDRLDMTHRPRLSDRPVMRVTARRPAFWRTATFDLWSGSAWARSDGQASLVEGRPGRVDTDQFDLAAAGGVPFHQHVRLEAGYVELFPAAAAPVSVDAAVAVAQWPDGTLAPALGAVGDGASYDVVSRQLPVTEAGLRSATGPVPAPVVARYAGPTVATDRVRALAARLARGAPTQLAKVRAIEAWMGSHTRYSQVAPLAPSGVDVVDDFLFESRLGWCEQIASSLTVLLRLQGVPARLATGFVPGRGDPITRSFEVLESDAHAWTEVWFPQLGWVPFDPTASVPLSGESTSSSELAGFWWANADRILLVVAVAAAVLGPLGRGASSLWRLLTRRRPRREVVPGRGVPWIAGLERRIERAGARQGRPRAPAETLTAYAAALGDLPAFDGVPIAAVGEGLDGASYGGQPTHGPPGEWEDAVAALESAAASARRAVPVS
jgi:transglutaminase-like putative cysteine protease